MGRKLTKSRKHRNVTALIGLSPATVSPNEASRQRLKNRRPRGALKSNEIRQNFKLVTILDDRLLISAAV